MSDEVESQMRGISDSLMAELAERLSSQSAEISERLVAAYRSEIVDYRSLPEGFIDKDVAEMARKNLLTLIAWLSRSVDEKRSLEEFRNSAVRRFRQGVSVQALLHAYRVWGQVVWNEISQQPECQASPSTGFAVAGEVMRYVNNVSLAVANSYLEESQDVIQDRQLAERDALEELISGLPISARVTSYLSRLGLSLSQKHCVVLVRRRHPTLVEPYSTRDSLATVRRLLPGSSQNRPLVGLREEEIVVILPVDGVIGPAIREVANDLAVELDRFVVGVSRVHQGEEGVSIAYREAADATRVADSDSGNRAYFYTDVLLRTVIEKSGLSETVLSETITPLIDYDEKHRSDLAQTLKTYIAHRFNLTRTAEELNVRPNTVKYRLERIREVSGRDPNQPDDLILLALGATIEGASFEAFDSKINAATIAT
ncbi:PucR family transcriptional regulator [Brevibacterium zhoupengii]|uniref:PucR family transcriptional regulator n=1 Tax=Brevibacterium zhoupengii TaxID=2898795 RepID=UPI001E4E917B|nr:helix-turn-helix domain-containing protein [Brevibacterium zhoupengii]